MEIIFPLYPDLIFFKAWSQIQFGQWRLYKVENDFTGGRRKKRRRFCWIKCYKPEKTKRHRLTR